MNKARNIQNCEVAEVVIRIDQGNCNAKINGKHPWQYAIENKSKELIECLIRNNRINEIFNSENEENIFESYSPLRLACEEWPGVAKSLIDNGADIEQVSNFVLTPYITAIMKDDSELIKLLTENRTNSKSNDSVSIIIDHALSVNDHDMIYNFIKNNIQLESQSIYNIFRAASRYVEQFADTSLVIIKILHSIVGNKSYKLDYIDYVNNSTVVNEVVKIMYKLNQSSVSNHPNVGIIESKKLASETLILLINNSLMTDDLTHNIIIFSKNPYQTSLTQVLTLKFFQEHTYFSIYRNEMIKAQLSAEARKVSDENIQRSIELKTQIDEVYKVLPKVLADLIVEYTSISDLDLAAANYFVQQATELHEVTCSVSLISASSSCLISTQLTQDCQSQTEKRPELTGDYDASAVEHHS